jgi:Protein of unknown function (DUF4241)
VACAMVRFRSLSAVSWEMAVLPNQNPADLPEGNFYGYGVDGGMGCFVDNEVLEPLNKDERTRLTEGVIERASQPHSAGCPLNLAVDPVSGANLIAFSAGLGDGAYASFWGFDKSGELCCLVTDFGVLVEHLSGEATLLLSEWLGRSLQHADLARVGLTVRVEQPSELKLVVLIAGGSCQAIINNAGKEYDSARLPYVIVNKVGSYQFALEGPLQADATVTLKFSLGVRAL